MGENIHLEKNVADGIAVIRLDRPKVNALSSDMMRDLHVWHASVHSQLSGRARGRVVPGPRSEHVATSSLLFITKKERENENFRQNARNREATEGEP